MVSGEAAALRARHLFTVNSALAGLSTCVCEHILARVGAKVYATDNVRFDVDGMWNRLDILSAKIDVSTLSAIGNHRLSQIPAI